MARKSGRRRHHYLPQMYLNRWTCSPPPPQTPWLVTYTRGSSRPKRRAPSNFAYEPGMYEVAPQAAVNGDPETVERELGKFESRAKAAIDEIDASGRLHEREHRHAVADFISLLVLRTRKGQLALERRVRELAETEPEDYIARNGGIAGVRAQLAARGARDVDQHSDDDLRAAARRAARYVAESKEFRIGRIFGTGGKVAALLRNMNWCVVTALEPARFVTSDAPVIVPSTGPESEWWRAPGVGFGQDGVEVWFPLDPKKAVVASFKPIAAALAVAPRLVEEINAMVAGHSLEYVICHEERSDVAELVRRLPVRDI